MRRLWLVDFTISVDSRKWYEIPTNIIHYFKPIFKCFILILITYTLSALVFFLIKGNTYMNGFSGTMLEAWT